MPTIKKQPTKRAGARELAPPPFTVSTADHLKAIGEPTRWGILGALLEGPASVQELSRSMGIPKGTIGHHVRVLADAGLIEVVERQRVRGVEEKRYARVAGKFRLPDEGKAAEIGDVDDDEILAMPLRSALGEATAGTGEDAPTTSVVVRGRMTPERARRFAAMIDVLADEFVEGGADGGQTFGFAAAVYVPDWSVGRGRRR